MIVSILLLTGYGLAMAQNGATSKELVGKAWAALANNDVKGVETYANENVEMYGDKARQMQASLKEYPYESRSRIFSFWALNDVGTGLFILGEAYQNAGRKEEARKAYNELINDYTYAQCWDTKGFFWKPAKAAKKKLREMDNG